MSADQRKILVVANETLAGDELLDAVRKHVEGSDALVVVIAPVNEPREGYVVYDNTRRAAAGRRLDRTLTCFREAGIPATGHVVDHDPLTAVKDAIAIEEPDELIVSTHPEAKSGWRRRNLLDEIRKVAGERPVEHVVSKVAERTGAENVLVLANETVVGEPLLDRIREKARESESVSFLIVCPQSDPDQGEHPEAERRLRQALTQLRAEGIEAHGQVAHPDPFTAAMHAIQDESIDSILVSTFPEQRGSSWLKRDLVGRLRERGEGPCRARRRRAGGGRGMSAHADAHHHGPPIANQSSRVDATVLGMFLFIASEAMLFGAFFTAYFFVRVVNPDAQPWPLPPFHLPVFVAGVNTLVLVTSSFTMHWALQAIKRGDRKGPAGRARADAVHGARVPAHPDARVRAHRLQPVRRRLRDDLLRAHGTARRPRLRRALPAQRRDGEVVPWALHARAPSRRRASRNLLALRRRNVDCGVRDDLPPLGRCALMARNPFRSEAEAYRFLLLTVGYFALIVAASAIATWLGVVVFVVLTAAAVWLWLRSRSDEPVQRTEVAQPGGENERRILVIANETVGGGELLAMLRGKVGRRAGASSRRHSRAELAGADVGVGRGRRAGRGPGPAGCQPRPAGAQRRPGGG